MILKTWYTLLDMAKAAQNKSSELNIDLLKAAEPSGRVGEAVKWVLNIGRYLIILTEIVALAIFVLSIKLSTDKNDLKDDISRLSDQVSTHEDFEREFRNTSKRFEEVKRLKLAHFETNKVVSEFLSLLPKGMKLDLFRIEDEVIELSGSFSKPRQLQTLVLSFSKSNKIVGLDIKELNSPNEDNPKYTFQAEALINKAGFTN